MKSWLRAFLTSLVVLASPEVRENHHQSYVTLWLTQADSAERNSWFICCIQKSNLAHYHELCTHGAGRQHAFNISSSYDAVIPCSITLVCLTLKGLMVHPAWSAEIKLHKAERKCLWLAPRMSCRSLDERLKKNMDNFISTFGVKSEQLRLQLTVHR